MVAAIIGDIVYGLSIEDVKHSYIVKGQESIEGLDTARAPGAYFTEFIPILKHIPAWLPGAAFKRAALKTRESVWKAHHLPYRMTREAMVESDGTVHSTAKYV